MTQSVDPDFIARLNGGRLLTTEVLYYMPGHPSLLQCFLWQTNDTAPKFPRLHQFLDHWRREIDAVTHSIRVAHADWIGPTDFHAINEDFNLN